MKSFIPVILFLLYLTSCKKDVLTPNNPPPVNIAVNVASSTVDGMYSDTIVYSKEFVVDKRVILNKRIYEVSPGIFAMASFDCADTSSCNLEAPYNTIYFKVSPNNSIIILNSLTMQPWNFPCSQPMPCSIPIKKKLVLHRVINLELKWQELHILKKLN